MLKCYLQISLQFIKAKIINKTYKFCTGIHKYYFLIKALIKLILYIVIIEVPMIVTVN